MRLNYLEVSYKIQLSFKYLLAFASLFNMTNAAQVTHINNQRHGCQIAIVRFVDRMCFGPWGFWTMAPLRCAAKFDPFLSLDRAPTKGLILLSGNTDRRT